MKHLSCLLPLVMLVVAACGRAPEADKPSAPAQVATVAGETSSKAIIGPCPFEWTCDSSRWYTTKAACLASCGPTCFREEHYNGHCIPR